MLYVERSNRTERLLEGLAGRLMAPGRDPLATAVVVVQGAGMERWIAQSIARGYGVCANTEFPFPRPFLEQVFEAASEDGAAPSAAAGRSVDPWEVRNLTWRVARHLSLLRDDPDFEPMARHFQATDGEWRLVQLARQIADLIDRYITYRPDWIESWERGALPTDRHARWQVRLYRALRADLGVGHMADRARNFLGRVASSEREDLERSLHRRFPDTIDFFAVSTLPPLYLSVIDGLSRVRDVHLSVLSPSRFYWADLWREVRDSRSQTSGEGEGGLFDPSELSPVAPVLAGLGRLGADFQLCLEDGLELREGAEDLFVSPSEEVDAPSLLRRLQSRLLDLEVDSGRAADSIVRGGDDSIRVHRCHGVKRELQIVEATLREAFERDPSLTAEDVIVMAPNIDEVAPEIEAVFGTSTEEAGGIPFRIADRGALRRSPVADAYCALLALAGGRARRSEVIDWLGREPVRERFGIEEADVERIAEWAARAGIRFGLDEGHRAAMGLVAERAHTWAGGLDRLALAHAVGPVDTLFAGLTPEPLDRWADPAALGGVGEIASILSQLDREIAVERSVSAWCGLLRSWLAQTLSQSDANAHEHLAIRGVLDEISEAASQAGFEDPIPFEAIRERVVDTIQSSTPPQAFLSGGVTFCELVPLRAIPFRVVVILGLCDGAFPRGRPAPAYDLMARDPRPGDRTPRNDDRYLFLEALLSVRDQLVLTVPGRDPRDGSETPSSAVVTELLDALSGAFELEPTEREPARGAEVGPDATERLREALVVPHPLQAFSPRSFEADGDPRLRIRDREAFEGARARRAALESGGGIERRFLAGLGEAESARGVGDGTENPPVYTIPIDDLVERILRSTRYFSRVQLGVRLPRPEEVIDDLDPLEFDALSRYSLGTAALEDWLAEMSTEQLRARLDANPLVPSGVAGRLAVRDLAKEVEGLGGIARSYRDGSHRPDLDLNLEFTLDLDGKAATAKLVGRLDHLYSSGRVVTGFTRLGGWRELDVWIRHLALCAQVEAGAEAVARSILVGRPVSNKSRDRVVAFGPVGEPHVEIARLVEWACRVERGPLPFFPGASKAYAEKAAGDDVDGGRRAAFTEFHGGDNSNFRTPELERDLESVLIWEGPSPLLDEGGIASHPSFEELARLFFAPIDAVRELRES